MKNVHLSTKSIAATDVRTSSEDDPILAELWRIREEQFAAYGYDIERQMADTHRLTFLFGNDVVTRSKSGEFEVVFKGTGRIRIDFDEAATSNSSADTYKGRQDG
jgi:hypothetical protein